MHEPALHTTGVSSAGRMTAVMRAAALAGPRVLRLGVVRDGRIVSERLFKRAARVTVGPVERADVVVPASDLPREHVLFEISPGGCRLGAEPWMRGRLVVDGEVVELGGASRRYALDDDARGKIVIGVTTILFQLVPAPPVQPRPQLPIAVTRRGLDVDLPTTIVAALSFLIHFLFVGAIYSDWVDPIVDDGTEVSGLVDAFHALPAPPLETAPRSQGPAVAKATPAPASRGTRRVRDGRTRGGTTGRTARSDAALEQRLEDVAMATIGALTRGPATDATLRNSEVPTAALDAAARRNVGVGSADPFGIGHGTTRVRPGETGGTLADLGKRSGADDQRTGSVEHTAAPKGNVAVPRPAVTGVVPGADAVVARMRPLLHGCYRKGQDQNPDAEGSVQLVMEVGPNGDVRSARASASGNLPPVVAACVQRVGAAATFAPPQGGSAVVIVPISFLRAK